jgi:HAD superfamily hydrolase (TIGR01509 family)
MKITSIIFDMDGVLIDAESIHKRATQQAFAHFGLTVTDEQYKPYRGVPDEVIMGGLSRQFPAAELRVAELLRVKNRHYEALEHLAAPIPGAVDFVLWAKARYKIALATSGSPRNRESSLRMLGLEEAFQCIVDRGSVTHPKPHPEVFLKASAGLGAAPAECTVIEDSVNGVTAAKAAGCRVIALTTSFSRAYLSEFAPDHVVDSFAEIAALLA